MPRIADFIAPAWSKQLSQRPDESARVPSLISEILPAELAIWGLIALCTLSVVVIVSRGDRIRMPEIEQPDE